MVDKRSQGGGILNIQVGTSSLQTPPHLRRMNGPSSLPSAPPPPAKMQRAAYLQNAVVGTPKAEAAEQPPPRPNSYDSTMATFEAEEAAAEVPEDIGPVGKALLKSEPIWTQLRLVANRPARNPREEAAFKLIANHEAVLRDVTNEAPTTQLDLTRASIEDVEHVDQALREISRRLLPRRAELKGITEEQLDPAVPEQAAAWAATAKYLDSRIQSQAGERPGREPDMSPQAAAVMRAVLQGMWWAARRH